MSLPQIISQIKNLLKENVFITEEQKESIKNQLDTIPPKKLNTILKTLQEAAIDQKKVITEVMKKNPHFSKDVEHKLNQEVTKFLNKKEGENKGKEEEVLVSLEKDIENLF